MKKTSPELMVIRFWQQTKQILESLREEEHLTPDMTLEEMQLYVNRKLKKLEES